MLKCCLLTNERGTGTCAGVVIETVAGAGVLGVEAAEG